ncbi:LysR family transcriptional regulator ArgP [Acinetobacter qingfengensis]|uniref:Transcriptional regulator ArgP n=1 Tax=Acinetobacter qingfengensis TaxID=1262585 RepID=A0A1E7RCT7_9GAMM|nr:LysR family transcriptional regulator ArgP [Acinetobacter qingfengensis]KAA8734950.1 LysR family transcriptional regulator ArgP [Acinetobacter qingfengensis]OEY97037.1 transcriptional regulator ArgP [Acinetobacter qingfengensis]
MLNSKQCQAFLAVIETGSFDQAGQLLCLTPSAISLRVQALEKTLGQLLLIRGRPCTLTQAGQDVLQYLQHSRLLEQNLLHHLTGQTTPDEFFKVHLAVNADSLSIWLLPALQNILVCQSIVTAIKIDDQSLTHTLLETGQVNVCISIEPEAMRGCHSIKLGKMRYRMMASRQFQQKWFKHGITREALRKAPAVLFNEKDYMHFEVLLTHYGLAKGTFPYHTIPSVSAFFDALQLGLGYGMIPDLQLATHYDLIEVMPNVAMDITLYWHHWKQQSKPLQALTQHIVTEARKILIQ